MFSRWNKTLYCLLFASNFYFSPASADCECGYSVNATTDPSYEVFTDLIESNFNTIQNLTYDTDWRILSSKFPYKPGTGNLGKDAQIWNVLSNPVQDNATLAGPGVAGPDAGLQFWTRAGIPANNLVPMGEIHSRRSDIQYGTVRASMKMTSVNGTCAALFWYFNDTQEIDMEFLSREINSTSSMVNLVLQSNQAALNGFNAAGTPSFDKHPLTFRPDEAFHEYRFDWTPEKVSFYADGQWLNDMTSSVPSSPGRACISHWSNGNKGWSGGPPEVDAVMTVAYFKAYFNSSDETRKAHYAARCKDPSAPNAICRIPEPDMAEIQAGTTTFFTDLKNSSANQTHYTGLPAEKSGGPSLSFSGTGGLVFVFVCNLAAWLFLL